LTRSPPPSSSVNHPNARGIPLTGGGWGRSLLGGIAQKVVDVVNALEDEDEENNRYTSPAHVRRRGSEGGQPEDERAAEEGLAKALYRAMHHIIEDPTTAWGVAEPVGDLGNYKHGRLIRCWRAQRLFIHIFLNAGTEWRTESLAQNIRCNNLKPPLPQMAGMPMSLSFFEACLQVITYQVWRFFQEMDGGRHEGAFLATNCCQILCLWLTENTAGVKLFLGSPLAFKLLDLLTRWEKHSSPNLVGAKELSWRVVLRCYLSALIATMFALSLEYIGDVDWSNRQALSNPPPKGPLAFNRLGVLRVIAKRMDLSDFLSLVESGLSMMSSHAQTLEAVVDDDGERGEVMKGLRKRVSQELKSRFFSPKFLSVMESAVGAVRSRVTSTIAEHGLDLQFSEGLDPNLARITHDGLTAARFVIAQQAQIIRDLVEAVKAGQGIEVIEAIAAIAQAPPPAHQVQHHFQSYNQQVPPSRPQAHPHPAQYQHQQAPEQPPPQPRFYAYNPQPPQPNA